jgi:hypothetical protein
LYDGLTTGGDNKVLSEETKQRINDAKKGVKRSEETKQRMKEARVGKVSPLKGRVSPLKGRKLPPRTDEHRAKLAETKLGEKNPNFGKDGTHLGTTWSEETRRKYNETVAARE